MKAPKKEFDIIVYIGRFQPFHNAHKTTIMKAREMATSLIVLVGSSSTARSPKNPWTYEERRDMIGEQFNDGITSITIAPLDDFTYDDSQWIAKVGKTVNEITEYNKDLKIVKYIPIAI